MNLSEDELSVSVRQSEENWLPDPIRDAEARRCGASQYLPSVFMLNTTVRLCKDDSGWTAKHIPSYSQETDQNIEDTKTNVISLKATDIV